MSRMMTSASFATTQVRQAQEESGGGEAANQDVTAPLVANVDTSAASRSNCVQAIIKLARSTKSLALAIAPPKPQRRATNGMWCAARAPGRTACARCAIGDEGGGGRRVVRGRDATGGRARPESARAAWQPLRPAGRVGPMGIGPGRA